MAGFVSLVVCSVCIAGALSYPYGAPPDRCASMIPGHGTKQLTSVYSLALSANTFNGSDVIGVSVMGGSFAGFLLEARMSDGSTRPQGRWSTTVTDTKVMRCTSDQDAVTHSTDTNKDAGSTFHWTAPSNCNPGTVKFYATVLTDHNTYWSGIESAAATAGSGYGSDVMACAGAERLTGIRAVCIAALWVMSSIL